MDVKKVNIMCLIKVDDIEKELKKMKVRCIAEYAANQYGELNKGDGVDDLEYDMKIILNIIKAFYQKINTDKTRDFISSVFSVVK